MYMCDQLQNICEKRGWNFKLIVPDRKNPLGADPFQYYQFKRTFNTMRLWCLDAIAHAVWLGPLAYWIQTVTFIMSLVLYCIKNLNSERFVYTRDFYIAALFRNNIWEAHTMSRISPWLFKIISGRIKQIVSITEGLRLDLIAAGYPADRIITAPDGIDLEFFSDFPDKKTARKNTDLPEDTCIAVYTGSFFQYEWKGVDVLLEAATLLSPDENIHVVLVGGYPEDFARLAPYYDKTHIIFVEHSNREQIKQYLAAADMLILPNKSGFITSERYTSPMKLFEYMATGRPIIASDLPSIREILDETCATLIEPNNPRALAQAIRTIAQNAKIVDSQTQIASQRILKYTWQSRAEKIFNKIQQLI